MNNLILKGLLVAVFTAAGNLLFNNSAGPVYWVITIAGVVMTYFGQHLINSGSDFGTVNLLDFLKTALVAIGSGISVYVASIVTTGVIDWHILLKTVGTIAIPYLAKNLASDSNGTLFKKEVQPTAG